jgi:hypothetical protein
LVYRKALVDAMKKETSTMSTTIAAPIAQLLRSGALISLSRSADDISALASAKARTTHPDKYRLPLRYFEQARALLDALAWHDTERPVTIDTGAHRRAIQEAARLAIDHEPISPEARDTLRELAYGNDSDLPTVVPSIPDATCRRSAGSWCICCSAGATSRNTRNSSSTGRVRKSSKLSAHPSLWMTR